MTALVLEMSTIVIVLKWMAIMMWSLRHLLSISVQLDSSLNGGSVKGGGNMKKHLAGQSVCQ